MRAIIPDVLWIGHAGDARDLKKIMELGIELLIDLAIEEPPVVLPREVAYCRFPIHDGDGNSPEMLISAIDTAARFVRSNRRTLVACSAGMSRSPAIAAAVISRLNKICWMKPSSALPQQAPVTSHLGCGSRYASF